MALQTSVKGMLTVLESCVSWISDWATVHIKVEVNMCSEEAYTEYCD